VLTAAEADEQLTAGLAAAASAGELLYLLRALSAWQWEEALHAVLLPAVVAALQGKVPDMQLQVRTVEHDKGSTFIFCYRQAQCACTVR
jgi:hypothetical protein